MLAPLHFDFGCHPSDLTPSNTDKELTPSKTPREADKKKGNGRKAPVVTRVSPKVLRFSNKANASVQQEATVISHGIVDNQEFFTTVVMDSSGTEIRTLSSSELETSVHQASSTAQETEDAYEELNNYLHVVYGNGASLKTAVMDKDRQKVLDFVRRAQKTRRN